MENAVISSNLNERQGDVVRFIGWETQLMLSALSVPGGRQG